MAGALAENPRKVPRIEGSRKRPALGPGDKLRKVKATLINEQIALPFPQLAHSVKASPLPSPSREPFLTTSGVAAEMATLVARRDRSFGHRSAAGC